MLEVAGIIRLYGAAYRQQCGNTLSWIQKRAFRDISACRTPFFGRHVPKSRLRSGVNFAAAAGRQSRLWFRAVLESGGGLIQRLLQLFPGFL